MRALRVAAALSLALVAAAVAGAEPKIRERTYERVTVKGNEAVPLKEIQSVMGIQSPSPLLIFAKKPKIPEKDMEAKVEDLKRFYQRRGFFESSVSLEPGAPGEAVVTVREGPVCKVASAAVVPAEGAALPEGASADLLLKATGLREGEPFSADAYEAATKKIQEMLWERGFAAAQVKPDAEVDLTRHTAVLTFAVTPGPKCTFGPSLFMGAAPGRESQLRNSLAYKEGEAYKKSLVDKSVRQIYGFGLFDGVSVVEKVADDGVVTLKYRLMEGRPRRIKLSAGYGTDEKLRGEVGWETAAFMNRALTAGVNAKESSLRSEGTLYLRKPYVLGGRFTAGTVLQYKTNVMPDFTYRALDLRAGLDQRLTESFSGALYGRFERVLNVNPKTDVDQALLEGQREIVSIVSAVGSVVYRHTDDLLDPTKGFVLSATAEPAYVVESRVHFLTATGEARYYQPVSDEVVAAFKLRVGAIFTRSDLESIPLNRRFYAGGANSVRGYTYMGLGPLNPQGVLLGGKGLVEASAELRFPVKGALRGLVFADAGNATLKPFQFDNGLYGSAGAGLRYKTPVGPVGVDLAFKLRKDPLDSKAAMIYLFVGYAF